MTAPLPVRPLLILAAFFAAIPLEAQKDQLSVGLEGPCVVTSTTTATMPIYVRDVSGTPLGVDQPPGNKLQGLAFLIIYSPTEAISSIRLQRSGVLAGLTPIIEFIPPTAEGIGYIGLFDETYNLIPFRLDTQPPGDLIAELLVTIKPNVPPGTEIKFTFGGSSTTAFTNQGGIVSETVDNRGLEVRGGCLKVGSVRRRAVKRR